MKWTVLKDYKTSQFGILDFTNRNGREMLIVINAYIINDEGDSMYNAMLTDENPDVSIVDRANKAVILRYHANGTFDQARAWAEEYAEKL